MQRRGWSPAWTLPAQRHCGPPWPSANQGLKKRWSRACILPAARLPRQAREQEAVLRPGAPLPASGPPGRVPRAEPGVTGRAAGSARRRPGVRAALTRGAAAQAIYLRLSSLKTLLSKLAVTPR